ncbi:hypothetical protein [Nonomuraea ceibae]|uniref:hypothetical protein n=1 Tax=Nonomuraea ceibae TaxID=1935170 RepID=UPI001C5EA273|nr:hypothetical protein [Nonomuraea ceibae]
MAQLHKGNRDASTVAVPLELKERIEAAAARHGFKRPGVYLTDLISALHPDDPQQSELAASIHAVIPALLQSAPVLRSGGKHVFAIRTPEGVKPRIKSAHQAFGYPRMTGYLVALMSALHPAPPKEPQVGPLRSTSALTPEAAFLVVNNLLAGRVDALLNAGNRSGYQQQTLLALYDLPQPQQAAGAQRTAA